MSVELLEPTASLVAITRCEELQAALSDAGHPCAHIAAVQACMPDERQVPEPWAGRIDLARLLFVSSNPSYDANEDYPIAGDRDEAQVIDYFQNRFGPGPRQVHQGIYPPPHDTSRRRRGVRYWINTRHNARWIYGRDVEPGIDYCLTEVVHCKSTREAGVRSALPTCARRWLEPVLRASAADVVVAVGALAREALSRSVGERVDTWQVIETEAGGRSRLILGVPHPNSHEPRRWDVNLKDQAARLRAALG